MRNFIGLSVLVLLSAACTQSTFDPGSEDAGGDGGVTPVNGGEGGSAPEASVPPGCDATKLPSDDICVVNDAEGVFASTSLGAGSNDGTKAHPLGSIDAAITAAKNQNKKRVYACAEIYPEQIHIQDGISVFGNLSCNGGIWALSPAHAKVTAPASPAASATNITSPTRIEAVDLVAPDFTTGSQSSIGLFANNAPGLHVVHATIHAGTGGKGAVGVNGVQLTDSGTAKNGQGTWLDGVCTTSSCVSFLLGLKLLQPTGGTNACTGEAGHDGGPGGLGGHPGEFQSTFDQNVVKQVWKPVDQGATGGFPSAATSQTAQGGGLQGAGGAGAVGANGTDGFSATDFGTLDANGYAAADGTNGTSGAPGQGGGGAGGYNSLPQTHTPSSYADDYGWGEPGSGGGAGGCPGLSGAAGKGGGASFGVVALASSLPLEDTTITSSKGGDGGAAGVPSLPTAGGLGGNPPVNAFTLSAGNGGAGGHAGVSGNGGGGPSIGIVYDKTNPTQLASKVTNGAGGAGVAARVVNGQTIPASLDGRSIDVYQFGQ